MNIIEFLKLNKFEILEYTIKVWFVISIVFINAIIWESLKIPIFFSIGVSFGIGWLLQALLFKKKKEINIFINKEILDEIKKLP